MDWEDNKMGKSSDVVKSLVSPITKLIEVVSAACGKVYEPIHIKRMAKANAFALKAMQEAVSSSPELAQSYNSGMMQIDNKELNELVIRSVERSLYQEMVKQQNLERVVSKTYGLLDGEPDVTNEPINSDWMARFINSVETINDDDMQFLWSKVLAREIKKPKTYSLRTLETLKNLSKEEALLFQKLCDFVITIDRRSYFINEDELLEKCEINMGTILKLNDCGIVFDSTLLNVHFDFAPNEEKGIFNDEIIVIIQNPKNKVLKLSFQVFPLTTFGMDLVSIVDKKTSNDFMIEFAKYLKKQFTDFNVTCHKINTITEGNINYNKVDLLN